MRIPLFSWLLLIPFFLIFVESTDFASVSGQCLDDDQRSLLLQLKGGLKFDTTYSTRLATWNPDEDYCSWNGVGCDTSGCVVTLELDRESISGGIDNSASLFKLKYLRKLNLALNSFNSIAIPSAIANLTNLVDLNLSNAGFVGQIPTELANLRKLVILDLSTLFPALQPLKLENPNLKALVQNLQNLEELYLNGVDISVQRNEWCQALASSSLTSLRVLSLIDCKISGPIDTSLSELHSLSVIRLDSNNLSTTVPDFFTNFQSLRSLSLSNGNLLGTFPGKIFQVSTLQVLDLSNNEQLQGSLPQLTLNGSLREIVLSNTKFSGSVPGSIGNLRNLFRVDLSGCSFGGTIPPAMENLEGLVYLDFSYNNFSGPVPSFQKSKNLSHINFSHNNIRGPLSPVHFGGLSNLVNLNLAFNLLNGRIPSYIFALPSLTRLNFANNQLSGEVDELLNASSSLLQSLDLSANRLNGSIPESFFDLRALNELFLSSNFFTGTIQLENIKNLRNLIRLELSCNNISIEIHSSTSTSCALPLLSTLKLASCKLRTFPDLANQSRMVHIDLSDNQIEGQVPNWIWKVGNGSLLHVNLSSNHLVGLQKPYSFPNLSILDLHSNKLQGEIPIPPASVMYLDYSSNNFNNSIPPDIGNYILWTLFFSLSNNRLTGSIPESSCNATNLLVLDLSDNALTGNIPFCLVEKTGTIGVLNLARNKLNGSIPDTFPGSCSLRTLDLSSNALEGKIPGSLVNCAFLEVLNVGNNKIKDTFPCRLKNSSTLRVLVLRSNKLHGDVSCRGANTSWSELQIIDIASNNFSGALTPEYFSGWRRMTLECNNAHLTSDHLRYEFLTLLNNFYYQDKVTVTINGLEREVVKILTIFTSIDFSGNKFTGKIPNTIGGLGSLYVLNLSHNAFTGRIPSSIGKLTSLGSLDLSANQLIGEIPVTLATLTFLSFLNLSYNKLSGRIPTGNQLQTFTADSYEENPGLCGYPLNTSCIDSFGPSFRNMPSHPKTEIEWEYVTAAAGFVVGLGTFMLLLLFCRRWRGRYFKWIDHILSNIVSQKEGWSVAEHLFRKQRVRTL